MLLSLLSKYVRVHFGLEGQWQSAPGERELNYRLHTPAGEQFGIKLGDHTRSSQELIFRAAMREVLAKAELDFATPQNVMPATRRPFVEVPDGSGARSLQVLTWVRGRSLRQLEVRPPSILEAWGSVAGRVTLALADFEHGAAYYRSPIDPRHALQHRSLVDLLEPGRRDLADYYFDLFAIADLPMLKGLRESVCTMNVHERDLLVAKGPDSDWRITGLRDVGEAVFTYTICDLAIACASASADVPDPVSAMASVVRAYVRLDKLSEHEVLALYPLVIGHLLSTLTRWAQARAADPAAPGEGADEARVWAVLERLREVSPRFVQYTFRAAAGYIACPTAGAFTRWLGSQPTLAPVIRWRGRPALRLDFSHDSPTTPSDIDQYAELEVFDEHVRQLLGDAPGVIGYGGYLETRPFYTSDLFRTAGNAGPRWRNVHLGLDLWSPAGEAVFAPFPGRVHSFRQNDGALDFGATIILEHRVSVPVLEPGQANRMRFWTLYGHLSSASLEGLKLGQEVVAGAAFAKTGEPYDNGGWPPHLHFQVILDLLGSAGDFPGVCFGEEREVWASVCPDPGPLAGPHGG